MRSRYIITLFAIIPFLLVAKSACAALVEADWLLAGDRKLTVDTSSSLEWLDLTESTNLSMNEILAGAGGFLDMGFRYATTSEVSALFAEANITDTSGNAQEENAAAALDFILLFGFTYQGSDSSGSNTGTVGYHLPDPLDASESTIASFVQYIIPSNTGIGHGAAMVELVFSGNRDLAKSTEGSFLVRETTVVPIPAAFWLFGSGLLGLIGIARKKKA